MRRGGDVTVPWRAGAEARGAGGAAALSWRGSRAPLPVAQSNPSPELQGVLKMGKPRPGEASLRVGRCSEAEAAVASGGSSDPRLLVTDFPVR